MESTTAKVLLFLGAMATVPNLSTSCGHRHTRPPPPPPPPKPPRINGCPSDITVTTEVGQLTATATWTPPTATSQNTGKIVNVKQTSGPKPGSEFANSHPVRIAYVAEEATNVPVTTCSFFVTVTVPSCPQLPYLQSGSRSCSGPGQNAHGTKCSHSCKDGYELQGETTITCQTSKTWSHSPPTCSPKSCGSPPQMENGYAQCFNGYKYPNMCSITCNPGYRTSGSPLLFCRADGSWSTLSTCVDKSPPQFPSGCPSNQQLTTGPMEAPVEVDFQYPEVTDNSLVQPSVTSDPARGTLLGPGYHIFRITATDGSSNRASCNLIVNIKARTCPMLWAPANGHVTCTRGYVEGSECSIACNHGYQVQGQAKITCLASESWNSPSPTCNVVRCPSPPVVDDGFYQCPGGSTNYGTSCYLVCDEGFRVDNAAHRYIQCGLDKTWSTHGGCEDIQAPVFPSGCPDNIDHSAARLGQPTLVTWDAPDVTDNSGQDVTLQSDVTPDSAFNIGTTIVTYTATDPSGNPATCHFKVTINTDVCPLPDLDPNMLCDCPDGYVYGATCTLNCTRGYPLDGPSTITCERDQGTSPPRIFWDWAGPSSVQPSCLVSTCPDLEPPDNGALSCQQSTFGYDCLMNCQENYDVPAVMVNDGHLYCTNSAGTWTPSTAPDCVGPQRPGAARLHSDLFYYTGSCSSSLDDIKQNFITRMTTHNVLKDACVNVPSCTVDNVKVTCGTVTGRKKRDVDSMIMARRHLLSMIVKRSTPNTHYIHIEFEITPELALSSDSTEQLEEKIESLKSNVTNVLTPLIANGSFDIPGTSIDPNPGTIYTTTKCPNGTKAFSNRLFSCVGCSKGHFMNESNACEECPVGSYTGLQEATVCTPCPEGWSTLTTGSTNTSQCKEVCTQGTSSPNGFAPCQPCPVGRYASRDGATTCDLCPLNTGTLNVSSSSLQHCIPADILLGMKALQGQIQGSRSSLTFSTWVRLPSNSNVQVFVMNSSSNITLSVFGFTSGAAVSAPPGTGLPFANFEVSSDAWYRQIVVLHASDVDVTQLPPGVHSLAVGSGPLDEPVLRLLSTNKRVLVSDVSVTDGLPTSDDVNADLTSCTRDNSNNLLSLTLSPSIMSVPSECDATNDCASSPCQNGGACMDEVGGFECGCVGGYSGPTCLQPPDSCYLHQCQNGATCLPGQGNYTCTCGTSFTGDRCQTQIVDGGWGEWRDWTECSATCGGQQQRQRLCNNPAPQHGGSNCTGEATQTQNCGTVKCSVNGTWESWSTWSPCSATCDGGQTTRQRECTTEDSLSADEVASCVGDSSETRVCNDTTVPCPVHGAWSAWDDWFPCSVTCGGGFQSRERSCDNPVPEYGGNDCDGNSTESRSCNTDECPKCTTLPRPTGGYWACATSDSSYLHTCNITCLPGYQALNVPPFICGPETGHKWPHEREQSSGVKIPLPFCQKPQSIQSTNYKFGIDLKTSGGSGCQATDSGAIRDNAVQQLGNQVECLKQDVCQMTATAQCQQNSSQRRKRSISTMRLTVSYTVDLGPSKQLNDTAAWNEYNNKTQTAEDSLLKLYDINSLYRLTIGGQTYTPDPDSVQADLKLQCPAGHVYQDRFCVPCPPGSMEESGQCELCPLGQYQDVTGATSCKHCPPGKAWDLPGASDRSLCLYLFNQPLPSSTPSSGEHRKGDNTQMILMIALPVVGLLLVVAISVAIYYKCKAVRRKKRRSSMGSKLTLSNEGQSPTPPTSYLENPIYYSGSTSSPPPAYESRRPSSSLSYSDNTLEMITKGKNGC